MRSRCLGDPECSLWEARSRRDAQVEQDPKMTSNERRGLSTDQAAHLLAVDGPNELPGTRERRLLAIAADVLTEPMLLLLIAAASVYFILGDAGEAMAIAASMLIVIG